MFSLCMHPAIFVATGRQHTAKSIVKAGINMKLVYICSPLRPVSPTVTDHPDELANNIKLACTLVAYRGFISVAPHIYFTQFLSDDVDSERRIGIFEKNLLAVLENRVIAIM